MELCICAPAKEERVPAEPFWWDGESRLGCAVRCGDFLEDIFGFFMVSTVYGFLAPLLEHASVTCLRCVREECKATSRAMESETAPIHEQKR